MKLVLTSQEGSLSFKERHVTLDTRDPRGANVTVSRANAQQKPSDNNAVFECKVLSRSHATFLCSKGNLYLKDNGSRNGSFINNHRLSKNFQESEENQLFSEDVVRFGAQARDDASVVEKCIIAKIKVLNDRGEDMGQRPNTGRLSKNSGRNPENMSRQIVNLEEKLKSETEEATNLREMLKNAKKSEDQLRNDLKQLNSKLETSERQNSDQLNSFNSKLEEKEVLLDKQISLLKTTTEDLAKAKGALVTSKEFLRMKEDKLVKLEKSLEDVTSQNNENVSKIELLETANKTLNDENNKANADLQTSQKELAQKAAAVEQRDEEIVKLKTLVDKDESELKERTGAYNELESLMTEEDATLQEAEEEIRKLLEIIAENQEIILKKDKTIIMLQNVIKEKEEQVRQELGGVTKADMEKQFNEAIRQKNIEIENLKMEMKAALEDLDAKTHKIEKEIDRNKETLLLKEAEIQELNAKLNEQSKQMTTHGALKVKCEELMKIIMKQNTDMEKLKNDVAIQEAVVNRNETLQKEILIMKVATQQKEVELQNYKELLGAKEKTIASIKKLHVDSDKEHGEFREKVATVVEEYEEEMSNLMQKIIKEQEINEQSENEIIQLRIELDNLRRETGHYGDMSKDEHIELLQIKDEEIGSMKTELLKEQQVNSHVHMVQEKEILDKERAITFLNKQLNIKQKENDCLRKLNKKSVSRDRSVTTSPNGDEDTIEQNLESEVEDDFIFVEDLKNDEAKNEKDNISLG